MRPTLPIPTAQSANRITATSRKMSSGIRPSLRGPPTAVELTDNAQATQAEVVLTSQTAGNRLVATQATQKISEQIEEHPYSPGRGTRSVPNSHRRTRRIACQILPSMLHCHHLR